MSRTIPHIVCLYKGVGLCFVEESDGLRMRRIRNQKCICLLLAIAIMISGMCSVKIPADSFFSCNQPNTIAKAERTFKNISACRTETLSQREVLSSLRGIKREYRKNQVRTYNLSGYSLSDMEIFPNNFQSKQFAEEDGDFCNASCSAAILSYIHNQDGEKAKLLILNE